MTSLQQNGLTSDGTNRDAGRRQMQYASGTADSRLSFFAVALTAVWFLAILTLWVQRDWPAEAFGVAVLLLAAAAIVSGIGIPKSAQLPLALLAVIPLWGLIQLGIGWSEVPYETLTAIWKWVGWIAVFYLGAAVSSSEELVRRVRLALLWFSVALAVEAILQNYLSPGRIFGIFPTPYLSMVMGPILYHNHFSCVMEAMLPIGLFTAFTRPRESLAYLTASAVLFTGVVVSASRGGLMLAIVEVVVVVLLVLRRGLLPRKQTIRILALVAGIAVMVLIAGYDVVLARFRYEGMIPGRLQFALSTLHMIQQRPLTGFGLGCWPQVYPAFALFDPGAFVNQAHCDWLQWFAEGGIVCGLAMVGFATWGARRAFANIWALGAIVVLVHAAFDYPFSRPAIGAIPILLLALSSTDESLPIANRQQRDYGARLQPPT